MQTDTQKTDNPATLRCGDWFGTNVPVRTHLGETGVVKGRLWTGQIAVEIDNSEDKQLMKRWLGNIVENYWEHELTLLCPNAQAQR